MLGSNGIGESLGGSRAAKMRVKNEGLFSAGLLQGPGGGWGTSEEGPPPHGSMIFGAQGEENRRGRRTYHTLGDPYGVGGF